MLSLLCCSKEIRKIECFLCVLIIQWQLSASQERCAALEFICEEKPLQCIPKENLCDGLRDCNDGSDETFALCNRRSCSKSVDFASVKEFDIFHFSTAKFFRCSYGACIPVQYKCDGVSNCPDGSDETTEACGTHRCAANRFKCDYGGCISNSKRCNGRSDCCDGSDETESLCQNIRKFCGKEYFRCHYGACIYKKKKCDGKRDCSDGSDESTSLCGVNHSVSHIDMAANRCHSSSLPVVPTPISLPSRAPLINYMTPSTKYLSTTPPTTSTNPRTSSIMSNMSSSTTHESPVITKHPITPLEVISPIKVSVSEITSMATPHKTTHASTGNIHSASVYFFTPSTPKTQFTTSGKSDSNSTTVNQIHSTLKPASGVIPKIISTEFPVPSKSGVPQSVCLSNECLCPSPSYQICVPCNVGLDFRIVCNEMVMEGRLCSMSIPENTHVEILTCGTELRYMDIDTESLRSNSRLCGTDEGVPANTLVYVACWGKSSELFTCQPDGKWHPKMGTLDPSHSLINLCQPSALNSNVCGKLPSARRDQGKRLNQWPFLVGLFEYLIYICSGTIVAPQWILTSANCFDSSYDQNDDLDMLSLVVQYGSPAIKNQVSNVSRIFYHPSLSSSKFRYDLVLLKLEEPLILSEELVPVCLFDCLEKRNNAYTPITITLLEEEEDSNLLKWDFSTMDANTSCSDMGTNCYNNTEIGEDQFCSKALSSKSLRNYISGSPYLINSGTDINEKWTLAGILSYSVHDSRCPSLAVFSSVCSHFEWISNCVERNGCPE